MTFSSDSTPQLDAEGLIRKAVTEQTGVALEPERLTLTSGSIVDVDGVGPNQSFLVEIFAHQGQLKGGQRHKIAGDILKLITIARDLGNSPRLALAFGDPAILSYFQGRSWLATAVSTWNIEIFIAELDEIVLRGLRDAQARQIMANPTQTT
jgi:hypothetical protein